MLSGSISAEGVQLSEPMSTGKPLKCAKCGASGQVTVTVRRASRDRAEQTTVDYLTPGFSAAVHEGRVAITCMCGAKVW